MHVNGVGQHHIFQHASFLTDFEFAVAVGALEIVMHVVEQFTDVFIFKTEFFRQHQRSTRTHPLIHLIEQTLTIVGLQKLQSKIEHDHGRVAQFDIQNISFNDVHWRIGPECVDVATAAFEQGRRVIDSNNFATCDVNITTHRERGGTQRTAQVINPAVRLYKALGQHTNHRNNIGVTQHGALDHVGEDFGNAFIKRPVAEFVYQQKKV